MARVVVHGSQMLWEGAAAGTDATGYVHWMILSGYLYPVCLILEGHLPTSGGRGGSGADAGKERVQVALKSTFPRLSPSFARDRRHDTHPWPGMAYVAVESDEVFPFPVLSPLHPFHNQVLPTAPRGERW